MSFTVRKQYEADLPSSGKGELTAMGELIEEIEKLKLDPAFNGHYHWGAEMMKAKVVALINQYFNNKYKQ